MNVLVTRPLKQAAQLQHLLTQAGHTPLSCPTLEVKPLNVELVDDEYDAVIFISKNAVDYGLETFELIDHDYLKIFAVGSATAQHLENHNIQVDAFPKLDASSEALLSLPQLRRLADKRVLIIRGRGGRETLKKGLEKKHNQVDYAEVYDRVVTDLTDLHFKAITQFLQDKAGAITITSVENLNALLEIVSLLDAELIEELQTYPLILLSQRIADKARELGFNHLYVADDTNDQALVQALSQL